MSRSPQPDTKTRDDPDIQTKCGNGNRVEFHNRGSPPQDGGSFNKAGANFLKRGRLSILWPNAYLLDVLTDFEDPLKTVCFTEENGLPPRQYDLFSVP